MKIMGKSKNEENLSNALPVRSNVSDVKMMPLMPYVTNVMRTLGTKSLTENRTSIPCQLGRVMLNTSRHRKITSVGIKSVIFICQPPIELNCLTGNTLRDAMNILHN